MKTDELCENKNIRLKNYNNSLCDIDSVFAVMSLYGVRGSYMLMQHGVK